MVTSANASNVPTASAMDATSLTLLTSLVVVDSLHLVFGRALIAYLHPAVSAMYLMAIGCAIVGAYGLIRRRLSLRALRQHLWFFLAIGFLVGASTVLTFTAVKHIDPGTGSMLARLSVLISVALGVVWLGERLNRRQLTGAGLSIAGVLIITFQPGEYLRLGSLLIIASTLMYALHTAIVKRYGGDIDLVTFFFLRLVATTAFLIAFVAISTEARETLVPEVPVWLLLITAGVVDVAVSRGLYYVALRRFPMSIHAIILTLSPAATILWSLFLFGTYPRPGQLLGGLLVLTGVVVTMVVPERRKAQAAVRVH
jgi:drug/metabolite transporter (DMT)-like permease